ncbi:phosphatase PAP2 family protein [Nanchangia anserum]|uniref:Phosphatase PAP2 family protein n=1 Tax=Nanchangia anserum TaxID=2692125 RepID=A0A8I0KNR7_9ACTO|nr:phosphatase PAP2 family protein [Nanchangia anserum]MBD3689571.1 phosphatase PAP2 family protein [Nanchangia anserum]
MPARDRTATRTRRTWRAAYLWRAFGAAAGLGALAAAWGAFVLTRLGQVVDTVAMTATTGALPSLRGLDRVVLSLVSIPTVVGLMIAAGVIAAVRRRPALAVRAAAIIALAVASTQILKHDILWRPDVGISPAIANSLPSGHVTAAATAAVALTIVVPVRIRSLVALAGAAWTALMGIAVVLNEWHRPSDVVAAIGVVTFYALLLAPVETGTRTPRGRRVLAWAMTICVAAAVVGLVAALLTVAAATGGPAAPAGASWLADAAHAQTPATLAAATAGLASILAVATFAAWSVDRLYS